MSPKKALILGTILLVPVLAFLFLKMFGVNRYSLRTYFPTAVDSTLVEGQWRYDTIYHQLPPFQLTNQTGKPFSFKDISGKISVVNFFSTTCQGLCKQTSTQLTRVQDAFRFQNDVKLLSVTLHPEQDNVLALQKFADSFQAEPSKWYFLTGEPEQISAFASKGFFLHPDKMSDSSFTHLQKIWLVDKEGHIRGVYDGSKALETDKLITEINVLLSEYKLTNGR